MIEAGLEGINFIAANTDVQALKKSLAPLTLQLGRDLTRGLSAGSNPKIGKAAALEDRGRIKEMLKESDMVFVIAGMGGGTGSGAAPVIAEAAKEAGALTIAAITTPFEFEGRLRMRQAEKGMAELNQAADTLIHIPNNRLRSIAPKGATFFEMLKKSDTVLREAVRGISDLIVKPGLVNLDFAKARSLMGPMRTVMIGIGRANGEDRGLKAVDEAIANPLLNTNGIGGASVILMNVTAPLDISIDELDAIYHHAREQAPTQALFVWGCVMDDSADCDVRVTIFCQPAESESLLRPSLAEAARLSDDSLLAEDMPMAGNYR
jgi:cell division protein FtsZ